CAEVDDEFESGRLPNGYLGRRHAPQRAPLDAWSSSSISAIDIPTWFGTTSHPVPNHSLFAVGALQIGGGLIISLGDLPERGGHFRIGPFFRRSPILRGLVTKLRGGSRACDAWDTRPLFSHGTLDCSHLNY